MNYSKNYLSGAALLDDELEEFDHNPANFTDSIGWTKTQQKQAESVRGKIELVKQDYVGLETLLNSLNGDIEHDRVQDYITDLFSKKISKAIIDNPVIISFEPEQKCPSCGYTDVRQRSGYEVCFKCGHHF